MSLKIELKKIGFKKNWIKKKLDQIIKKRLVKFI